MSNKYCKIGSMYMDLGIIQTRLQKIILLTIIMYYPLANEIAKGYSIATVRPSFLPSFRNILVNTLESTSLNGF